MKPIEPEPLSNCRIKEGAIKCSNPKHKGYFCQPTKWVLTRLNDGYKMTRIIGQKVEDRELTSWEKIKYWYR